MQAIRHILSTRPLDEALVADALRQGVQVDCISFIETEAIETGAVKNAILDIATRRVTAIFTSMNAVGAVVAQLAGKLPSWDIFCMGNTTRQLVEKYFGAKAIVATASNASELAGLIIEYDRERKIAGAVFFCGNQRRDELPKALRQNNIQLQELVVYHTLEKPAALAKGYDAVLFFSPSAVHSFFTNNNADEGTVFFAIGGTTASAIKSYCSNDIIIGQTPAKDGLLRQAVEYYTSTGLHP